MTPALRLTQQTTKAAKITLPYSSHCYFSLIPRRPWLSFLRRPMPKPAQPSAMCGTSPHFPHVQFEVDNWTQVLSFKEPEAFPTFSRLQAPHDASTVRPACLFWMVMAILPKGNRNCRHQNMIPGFVAFARQPAGLKRCPWSWKYFSTFSISCSLAFVCICLWNHWFVCLKKSVL